MSGKKLIECVPNFSEGRDMAVIDAITAKIKNTEGVQLLDIDPGQATHRTVVTFVGEPEPVIRAAFAAMKKAAELIDMRQHKGEHPRMGATDVCPLIPVANISMEEVAEWAHKLAQRVGEELDFPVYMYESAATQQERRNLAHVRSGEYEGLADKIKTDAGKPDYGKAVFNPQAGATAIGARDFLIAYNVNLNTTSVRRANTVAFDIREKGRVKREGGKLNGKVLRDENGEALREPGSCLGVKAIGWYIDEYGVAQISMNITDIGQTSLHKAFEACRNSANSHGMRVTGSELVGLVPLQVMLDAGKYFLKQQRRSMGVSDAEIIKIAVKSMGLDELAPFDPRQKIIEYRLADKADGRLKDLSLSEFVDEAASESMAPGGGSISAYVGALAASMATMVANISANRKAWDHRWEEFSQWAERGQKLKDELLHLVDEDTRAFNGIIEAIRLPKGSDEEKRLRTQAISNATRYAIEIPFRVLRAAMLVFPLAEAMVESGNPNSVSDAGVAALCARAAAHGSYMNVYINTKGFDDTEFCEQKVSQGKAMVEEADKLESRIRERTFAIMDA